MEKVLGKHREVQEPLEAGSGEAGFFPRVSGWNVALRTPLFWTSGPQNYEKCLLFINHPNSNLL